MSRRKSPVRHKVKTHKRKDKTVHSYTRGKGSNPNKLAKPTINIPGRNVTISGVTVFLRNGETIKGAFKREHKKLKLYQKPLPEIKHYLVEYRVTWGRGDTHRDTTNVFVKDKKDIKKDISDSHFSHIPIKKRPKIIILEAKLHRSDPTRLEALMDADSRTRSRLDCGDYVFTHVNLLNLKIPPVRSHGRYADNIQKIGNTGAVPPIYLSRDKYGALDFEDGVHRANAARDLGYRMMPALIYMGG